MVIIGKRDVVAFSSALRDKGDAMSREKIITLIFELALMLAIFCAQQYLSRIYTKRKQFYSKWVSNTMCYFMMLFLSITIIITLVYR